MVVIKLFNYIFVSSTTKQQDMEKIIQFLLGIGTFVIASVAWLIMMAFMLVPIAFVIIVGYLILS